MLFPILEVHSLPKLHDFFGMCFSLRFMFHFPWFQVWTLTISWNCLVLYLAFFVSNSSIYLFKDSQKLQCYFFPWDPCLHLGKSKIFGSNRIISFFLIPFALISLFLFGNFFGAACLLFMAWTSSFLRTLTGPYSIH